MALNNLISVAKSNTRTELIANLDNTHNRLYIYDKFIMAFAILEKIANSENLTKITTELETQLSLNRTDLESRLAGLPANIKYNYAIDTFKAAEQLYNLNVKNVRRIGANLILLDITTKQIPDTVVSLVASDATYIKNDTGYFKDSNTYTVIKELIVYLENNVLKIMDLNKFDDTEKLYAISTITAVV